jgi:protein-tyrosine kinase
MSRIYEALKKANEQKKEHVAELESANDAGEGVQDDKQVRTDNNGTSPQWWLGSRNGHQPEVAPSVSSLHPVPRSWRERLEELFFGWDLKRYQSYPIVVLERESAASEQYKILREQVKRLCSESGARCVSVTSPIKQDGKTTVAVNLAAALALEYEEQVLLIDGDLRSPQIHRYFGLQRAPGLSDYLRSSTESDLSSFVRPTFLPGLKVLPAGESSDLSSELLARLRVRNLMEEIRSTFPGHQIIVDTPPVLSTPDSLILAREVDGVIMVIKAGKTRRDYLAKAVQSLNSSKLMGVVFNNASLGVSSKYYYYYSRTKD